MTTIIEALRDILGEADFIIENGNYSSSWDYGAMIEYFIGALILMIVVSNIFKFIYKLCK